MSIIDFLPILAGIGLFLFGMNYLSASLEKIAGARLEKLLEKLTSNRFKGILLGTGVTAVIQSSSATTIMCLGLLNAGIMNLENAVPVIMGANIGTTVTAQILRLGDLGGGSILLSLLKPSSFGPVFIAIGAFLILFTKSSKKKDIGALFLGLGMIFFGISTMENTLTPLREMAWFQNLITMFDNPLLGLLMGAGMTALLQSSSASVGIIQVLSSTGAITFKIMVPVILGMNVGKCITVILASIGAKKTAKRAVLIDVTNNVIGMTVFMVAIYAFKALYGISCWDAVVTRGNIADFHTCFNLINGLLLLPLITLIIRFACSIIKEEDAPVEEQVLDALNDQLLLSSPNLAIRQCRKAVLAMAKLAKKNFRDAISLFNSYSPEKVEKIKERENLLDKYESTLSNYLVRINQLDITEKDNLRVSEMMHTLTDFERIGDHATNIMDVATYDVENKVPFSAGAKEELRVISQAITDILALTVDALALKDLEKASQVEPFEEVIDKLQDELREKHIERLINGTCRIQSGISFVELLTNLERISDHCSNIALNQIQTAKKGGVDLHAYQQEMHHSGGHYQQIFDDLREKYSISEINYDELNAVEESGSLKDLADDFDYLPGEDDAELDEFTASLAETSDTEVKKEKKDKDKDKHKKHKKEEKEDKKKHKKDKHKK